VQPLPAAGRPADFTGLVGSYSIIANASPKEVRVGDPITLTLQVAGPDFMGNVKLPPLAEQPDLARDFKVPSEISPPQVSRNVAAFTQTIRPTNPGVKQIPPIRLPYFDPDKGVYEEALSEPIPLEVSGARMLTADDVEGEAGAEPERSGPELQAEGIAHNYSGAEVLARQTAGLHDLLARPLWLGLLLVPPVLYVLLLAAVLWRRSGSLRRDGGLRRGALRRFLKRSREARSPAELLAALREYLVRRLRLSPGAVTFSDFAEVLAARSVPAAAMEGLEGLLKRLEAACYAGQSEDLAALRAEAAMVAAELEGSLR